MNKYTVLLTNEEVHKLETINNNGVVFNVFLEQIIRERINYIQLDNGFFYNFSNKTLYDIKGVKIKFTKKEGALFDLLISASIENADTFVDVKSIAEKVWKSVDATVYTIRNKIKSIRGKTFHELIINKSNIGYRINLSSIQIDKD